LTAVSVYCRHVADRLPETTAKREIIPRHANLTFPAREEALETARLQLDRLIQTLRLPSLLHHLSVEASVAAVVEATSNFVAAAVAGETWTNVTFSEEIVRLPYHAGRRETRGT
jgi:hypothetical protein